MRFRCLALISIFALGPAGSTASAETEAGARSAEVASAAAALQDRVIAWRRHFHQHPELSNREFETAERVAAHLRSLDLEVRTGLAHTGVLGILRGDPNGPVVALRADMDALPVTEAVDLPFASKVRSEYLGREVGVMHACGHDAHTAILMGVAELLSARRPLPGTVLFVFQPAEEGAPPGERGGARLMLEEGVFDDPAPDSVFGLHVVPQHRAGEIGLLSGGAMASSDRLRIVVHGVQTHAAYPWLGADPIAGASRLVLALHAIPARRVDARIPSVVSIGAIHGGVRGNIIPDQVELLGTIRSLDPEQREALHREVRRTAEATAEAAGTTAEVEITLGYPITWNDPALTERARPILASVVGAENLVTPLPRTGAEDFSFLAQRVPGVYFWLGIRSPEVAEADAAPNHSPYFTLDESALALGVRALSELALDAVSHPRRASRVE